MKNIYVYADNLEKLGETIKCGKNFNEKVNAIVCSDEEAKKAFSYGADKVYLLDLQDDIIENHANTIASFIDKENSLIILANSRRCKALGALLGATLNAGAVSEVMGIEVNDSIKCKHLSYGGLAVNEEEIVSSIAIVMLANGVYECPVADDTKSGEIIHVELIKKDNPIQCISKSPKTGSSVELNKAKKIVAIGRGIAKQEDIRMAEDLCAIVDAELGCSRPIAEAEKWLGTERYIGISSVNAKPDVYMAIGISGQIQHMVGIKDSSTIIAINKDKNAPIFEYADYGIVGDLYKILPILNEKLKK